MQKTSNETKDRHKLYFKGIAILLCLFTSIISYTQSQISFRQLSVKQGLSQNSAISIAQDSIGFLWIATQNGLNKYDGRAFTTYPFDFLDITRPNYSNLGKVYVDRKGQVWIIPLDKKLYKLNTTSNLFEVFNDMSDVSTIYQDKKYNFWVGTYSKGLLFIDGITKKISKVLGSNQLKGAIYDINEQSTTEVLVTSGKQLIEINIDTKISTFIALETLMEEKSIKNFSASIKGKSGKQWIGTFGGGLFYRDQNKNILNRISQSAFSDPLPLDLNILDLHIDSQERLWIATYGRGLYLVDFRSNNITHFNTEKQNPKALHYNDILCVYEDYSGTLWFGTDGAGLSYYDEYLEKFNSFTNLQTPEDINIDVIRAIEVDNEENVWIGTSGKGLTQYEPQTNSWRTFTTLNSKLPSDRIMSLYLDNENELWIGTQGEGLIIYNDKESKFNANIKDLLTSKTIWDIFKDSKGRIWLGTQNDGLIEFDKQKGKINKYTFSKNIRVITEDKSGNLWIGTDANGLFKFNIKEEKVEIYFNDSNNNSTVGNSIKSLYYSDSNILWVGLNGKGLVAFDTNKDKFYSFTERDGLANNVIYGILPDKNNNLWLSSNKGITKFSIDRDSLQSPTIVNYNNYAGLATEFNTGAYFSDKKGNLYFGGLEGFYWFDPNIIKENSFLPKTAITSFEIFNEDFPIESNIKLKHNQNTLSFSFSSLQYSMPEKNEYKYKLRNYDNDWIYAENNNFARYTQLPPGDYSFQVKSSNYDGVWNEIPETFNFSITAPWYFNNISKVIYILLFFTTLFGIYSYLKWRWRMKLALQLKEKESQQLKKLNDYKSKLYTDIAHEFKTPLTLISGPIDSKLTEGKLSDYDYANFTTVKRNANRLTELVDQLLQLARLENGKIKLKIFQNDLGLFLHTIVHSFDYKASTKKIKFTVQIANIPIAWYDEDAIEKIVTNLLSNAFKYSPHNGKCKFKAQRDKNNILIMVKNTTDNLPDLKNEDLFSRFYQKDTYAEGAGVGLSIVKELVKLYDGDMNVFTEENTISFKVRLPINKEAFNEDCIVDITKIEPIHEQLFESVDLTNNLQEQADGLPILLIVEDNIEVRSFIKLSLKHKYQFLEAENGKVGVERAIEHVPDIILSDIKMPVFDGIKLCNTLKSDERTSHIPIILLTASSGEENEMKGLKSGADDFITKPFKLRLLEKRIDNLIQVRKALRTRYSQEFILKPKDISITNSDESFLNRVEEILDTELQNPEFNAASFSKIMTMSRMQLHRKLMAYTGLSTTAFIRSQRLKQALEILRSSDTTISEVAYTVGFNTPSYFIKSFKEIYKKTPSEYLLSIDK